LHKKQAFLSKIEGPTIYNTTIPFGLTQYVPTDPVSPIPNP